MGTNKEVKEVNKRYILSIILTLWVYTYAIFYFVPLIISFLSYHGTRTGCYLVHSATELKMDSSFHYQMELIHPGLGSSKS